MPFVTIILPPADGYRQDGTSKKRTTKILDLRSQLKYQIYDGNSMPLQIDSSIELTKFTARNFHEKS